MKHPNTLIGLEITESALRLLRLSSDEVPKWYAYHSVPVAPKLIMQGKIKDPDVFIASLKELFAHPSVAAFEERAAIVSIPEETMYVHSLTAPITIPASDIPYLIMNNARVRLPFELREMFDPDYAWQTAYVGDGNQRITVCCSQKNLIQEYQELLDRAGVTPIILQTPTLALQHAVEFPKGATIFYLIESYFFTTAVYIDGKLVFKRTRPLTHLFDENSPMDRTVLVDVILDDFKKTQEFIHAEFNESMPCSLAFFLPNDGEAELERKLREKKAPVVILQPLITEVPAEITTPRTWLISLGNALRGRLPRNHDTYPTLLPFSPRQHYDRLALGRVVSLFRKVAVSLVVCYIVSLGAVYGFLASYEGKIDEDLLQVVPSQETTAFMELEKSLHLLQADIAHIAAVAETQKSVSAPLEMLRGARFQDVTLTQITITPDNAGVFRISLDGTAETRESLVAFKSTLEKIDGVAGLSLPLQNFEEARDLPFSVTFTYAGK